MKMSWYLTSNTLNENHEKTDGLGRVVTRSHLKLENGVGEYGQRRKEEQKKGA